MSTIGSDASLTRAALERLDGQASIDGLQRRDQELGTQDAGLELRGTEVGPAGQGPGVDSGEAVLNAAAWTGTPAGQRLLPGDTGFEGRLGGMPLSLAADSAADAVLAAVA